MTEGNDHLYHGGKKLTEECYPCMGRGQLKTPYLDHLQFSYLQKEAISQPINMDVLIIMCEACDGHGIIINYTAWMKFKINNSPDVVYLAEQFLTEHLKPEYC